MRMSLHAFEIARSMKTAVKVIHMRSSIRALDHVVPLTGDSGLPEQLTSLDLGKIFDQIFISTTVYLFIRAALE